MKDAREARPVGVEADKSIMESSLPLYRLQHSAKDYDILTCTSHSHSAKTLKCIPGTRWSHGVVLCNDLNTTRAAACTVVVYGRVAPGWDHKKKCVTEKMCY